MPKGETMVKTGSLMSDKRSLSNVLWYKKYSGGLSLLLILLLQFSLSIPVSAQMAEPKYSVEPPKHCRQCGMDRTVFDRSRMIITYEDGDTAGLCSIHCAAVDMKQNKGKRISSIKVADYHSRELIDAKSASWVIGGNIQGVMTTTAKWAFAKKGDAEAFVRDNGGRVTTYDEAISASTLETENSADSKEMHKGHSHAGHSMGPGSQMVFNPGFGDDIYHTHPAGMWMFNYKLMHMYMSGLRDGTSDVAQSSVGYKRGLPYEYMMIPTKMTMDMHMFMAMYGITDKLTVMMMVNYLSSRMEMLMDMGPGKMIKPDPPMEISGFGDTEVRGIYKLSGRFIASLGLSLPTGDIGKDFMTMKQTFRAPYDMQLGSGSYDLKPAITFSDLSDDEKWNWGAQIMYTWHTADNRNDYRQGDTFRATGWLQRALGPATSWMRLAYTDTGKISGADPEIEKLNHPTMGMGAPMPDADPNNYGGRRVDGMLGISLLKGPVSIGIEAGMPLYQDLNGLQLKTKWFMNAGIQVMF